MRPDELSDRLSDRVKETNANHLFRGSPRDDTRDDSPQNHSVDASRTSRTQGAKEDKGDKTERLDRLLTDDDRGVLETLAIVRMASGAQLNRLHWPLTPAGARTTRRRLQRLSELRILTRLHRQVGGIRGGSQGQTFALDVVGQRIVQAGHLKTIRRPTPSDFFVDHTLAVTEIYVSLKMAASESVGLVAFQPEPECWRQFTGLAGRTMTLRPDAYATWTSGDWELSAFFEVDRATEHPGRVGRKAEQYVRYWQTGQEQRDHQVFPSVVWVTPHERRTEVLRSVIAELDESAQSLFVVITTDELTDFINNTSREEGHP